MTQIIIIYYYQFWNFSKKTTKMLNSDLVSFALMKLSNSGPIDAYTHDWRGFNETRQKNLFKSGLLEIDTLNSVDTFS